MGHIGLIFSSPKKQNLMVFLFLFIVFDYEYEYEHEHENCKNV
jgi:hypothetical protein